MNTYPLIYVSTRSGFQVRFRRVGPGKYERSDGTKVSTNSMRYNYEFIRSERSPQKWVTTVNGFRVRIRG